MSKILQIIVLPLLVIVSICYYAYKMLVYIEAWIRLALNVPDRIMPSESDDDHQFKIRQQSTKEALQWLSENPNNTIYGFSNTKSQRIISRIFKKGAVEVYALDIEVIEQGGEYSRAILIELPEEGRLRTKLFDWEYMGASTMGFSGVLDNGQRYLFSYWT